MPIKAFIQSLSAVFLWSMFAFLGLQLAKMPPFLLMGIALMLGSLCSIHKIAQWKVSWKLILLGIYGIFGAHFFLILSVRYAPPIEANLINYLWPLLIIMFSPLVLPGYSLKIKHILAAFLGVSGAALIITGGKLNFDSKYFLGYIFAASAGIIWASYSLIIKRISHFPDSAVGLFCFCSGILSLIVHYLLEPSYVFATKDFPLLFILGIGPLGGAILLWNAAIKNGDPRILGPIAYLTPMLSTIILVVTGSDKFTWISGIAMLLILGSASIGASGETQN